MIRYFSTRHNSPLVTFEEALFRGLAPDGGLYFPDSFPRFTSSELAELIGASLPEVGYRVLAKWFADHIPEEDLRDIAYAAQHFPIPWVDVGPVTIMELFHGPTKAFKDVAAQNLSRLMSYFLNQQQREITLLVATSGDTGGAIAHGFADVPHIQVVVLYPKGRVSGLQEEQLTRVAANVQPLEIDGVFDDCQTLVKTAFNDPDLAGLNLTSANSISIGRLIPQIIYYVYAYANFGRDDLRFVVPSGNFGNLTGGLFAREMGLPFDSFVAATNANTAVVEYVHNGRFEPRPTVQTLSNAMDVGNPSNFTRIQTLFDYDYENFREVIAAGSATDAETVATIQQVYEAHGYLLDPHTAVGWSVAEKLPQAGTKTILLSTAAPVKFAAELKAAAGIELDDRPAIAALQGREKRVHPLPNQYAQLKEYLLSRAP